MIHSPFQDGYLSYWHCHGNYVNRIHNMKFTGIEKNVIVKKNLQLFFGMQSKQLISFCIYTMHEPNKAVFPPKTFITY